MDKHFQKSDSKADRLSSFLYGYPVIHPTCSGLFPHGEQLVKAICDRYNIIILRHDMLLFHRTG